MVFHSEILQKTFSKGCYLSRTPQKTPSSVCNLIPGIHRICFRSWYFILGPHRKLLLKVSKSFWDLKFDIPSSDPTKKPFQRVLFHSMTPQTTPCRGCYLIPWPHRLPLPEVGILLQDPAEKKLWRFVSHPRLVSFQDCAETPFQHWSALTFWKLTGNSLVVVVMSWTEIVGLWERGKG